MFQNIKCVYKWIKSTVQCVNLYPLWGGIRNSPSHWWVVDYFPIKSHWASVNSVNIKAVLQVFDLCFFFYFLLQLSTAFFGSFLVILLGHCVIITLPSSQRKWCESFYSFYIWIPASYVMVEIWVWMRSADKKCRFYMQIYLDTYICKWDAA